MKVDRELHTAKRPYVCDFCNKTIPVNTKYIRYRGLHEGGFATDRRHLTCCADYLVSQKCDECGGGMGLPETDAYAHCTC